MSGEFERLFEPGLIGNLEVRNRIVMAAMATTLGGLDGRYTRRQIDYYAERARGGVGLIIAENVLVREDLEPGGFRPWPKARADADCFIHSMTELVETVHAFGAKIALQLTAGRGRQAPGASPDNPPAAPSALPAFANPDIICRPLTLEDIRSTVDGFESVARRAVMAGFDAIEIHGHVGYLIDEFLSPRWNKRTDEYGGDLDNRLRFALEVVQAIRRGTSANFPIIFRLSVDHKAPGGRGIEEGQEIARRLAKGGVSAIHADAGCYDAIDWVFPPNYLGDGCMVDMAAAIKKVVDVPVIAVGNLTPEVAERVLESGGADFVASGRALVADADWPNKVRHGLRSHVRPCLQCNFCTARLLSQKSVACAVNARAGSERYYPLHQAEEARRVLVVGGGPAGMEAARVAATRGHRVTLMEKTGVLGGLLTAAGTPPFKKQLRELVEWWSGELQALGVEVILNAEVTPETPELSSHDAIVVATGGRPLRPAIPGIDSEDVVEVLDCHLGRKPVSGRRVVIAGGGLSGCDAGLELAMKGYAVTIVEMLDEVARDLDSISRVSLLRLLHEHDARILTGHRVKEFRAGGLVAQGPEGQEVIVEGDTVIVALGVRPDAALATALKASWPEVYAVGDCVNPAKVREAVKAGFDAAWQI